MKQKSRTVALILASIPHTGILGIDRFYLGYVWTGLLKLITAGGCLVWYVIDIIRISKGITTDSAGRPLIKRQPQQKIQHGTQTTTKQKSRSIALFLAICPITALCGVDRFYLGYIWSGLLKILTGGGILVLYVMDIVRIARGTATDKWKRPLRGDAVAEKSFFPLFKLLAHS